MIAGVACRNHGNIELNILSPKCLFSDNAAFTTEIRDERTVVLSPKEEGMRSFISRIELKLADQAGLLDSVTIFEGPDSSTRLSFSHAVLNQSIAQTLFTRP